MKIRLALRRIMPLFFKAPFGDLILLYLLGVSIFSATGNNDTTVNPLHTPAPHRGAARQMYGSGSLRPHGAKPVYATGQRHHGVRSTISPNPSRLDMIPQPLPYPVVPYPFSISNYDKIPGIFLTPNVVLGTKPYLRGDSHRSKNRGGMYGGRPEYYSGKPNHGFVRGKYPFDFGFIGGRGFEKPEFDLASLERLPNRNENMGKSGSVNFKFPEEEGKPPEQLYEHNCGSGCLRGEYLCVTSCTCIKLAYRCDGDEDCEGDEDELECGESEIYRNTKCDESESYVRCPHSGKCILKDWLCDGDDDCGDFSDETHCGFAQNCTSDQFECANGLCISRNWVCDNDVDCKDYSDEMNCTKTGCTEDEFECGDGSCISVTWKCDRQIDCSDESDESHCDIKPSYCEPQDFQCASQKCIKIDFKCDGDDDCGDWSDEDHCENIPENCVSGEFKCNNGKCIPERYRCDKQQDCEDNEDEANCDYTIQKTCSPDEHTCKNGACILKTWVCDGFNDCIDRDDEVSCEIVCDESKFACMGADPSDNSTDFCIHKKHVCDGQKDCPRGEDEIECSTKRECEKGTNCTQLCITTHVGAKACSCLQGYNMAADGITCEDVDECMYATDPVCSQKCTNTVGSFKCGCMTGYILRPDLRSCKALGAPPTLLFANRKDIRQVSLSNSKYTAILRGLHNAIALDYHYEKNLIFWSDVSIDVIKRATINGTLTTDVIKAGLESPGGIALDWIHDLIFWTDSGTRRIEVATIDGKSRAIVAANDVDKPRAIVVHPGEALVFWTDWGPNPKIERSEMDGKNRKSIVTESVFWPNGLTIDYTTNTIFWADAKHNVIETAFLDGSGRKKVISKGLPHPFAITIFEDAIYWTDWHTKSISTANKATGAGLRTIHSKLHFPMDIRSFHSQRQPKFRNHCGRNNGGCAHMCVPNKTSFSCLCRLGQRLAKDRKSCEKPEKMLFFARKKDLRIKHLDSNAVHQHEIVIPVDGIKSAVAIAWDARTDSIFWTDVERDTINSAFWNGSDQKILVNTNLESPAGLALDWITSKLYWTDADGAKIEVAELDGSSRSLLIWDGLDKPRDIVVDPIGGNMYWSDWGEKPKIESSAMDGTMRLIIVKEKLTWPNGLAIDYGTSKLYWSDGGIKTIEFANLDGSDRKTIIEGKSIPHPFGLDVFGNYIYWTDWTSTTLERADKYNGKNRTILGSKIVDAMDVRVFHRDRKIVRSTCNTKNGGCSHLCLLRPDGHSCACPTGIKLGDDGKTCANRPTNFLLLAHRTDIRQISLDVPYTEDVVLPFPQLKMAISVDVDRKTGEIYWADTTEDAIQKSTPDGKNVKVILMHELLTPDGIAIDSAGRKIYWTDGDRNSVEVAELDGTNRKVLFSTELDKPRAITLHYHHGLVFWSDYGESPKIEVAFMDGTKRKTLINKGLVWPNGLAIDRPAGRLYWNDGKLNKIESCALNGSDRKEIVKGVPHPYGLVVVGNHIYWTDWQTQGLHRADKMNGSDRRMIRGKLEGLMDVRAVQSDNIAENACGKNNGGCSHLCLRNPTSYTCACPTGLRLSQNNSKHCEDLPSTFLLISTKFAISRVSLDTQELWDVTLPIPNLDNVIDIDFHWEKKMIYYTDLVNNSIRSINMLNLSDVRDVIYTNLSSPDGLAVDWIAGNLYWTNTGKRLVEVSKLDGSSRKTIIKDNLQDPRSIAVFPKKGFLYWSDWGSDPKIERSYMDGSSRKIIAREHLNFPVGLVVDYVTKRLYWIDAKPNNERIETSDLAGGNRVVLTVEGIHPFSLTQFGEHIYWTDWRQNSVSRADKSTARDPTVIRPNLDAAMGLTMVAQSRQTGWNPCAENNGGCPYLCFFTADNYSCGCADREPKCYKEPPVRVPNKCPHDRFKCGSDDENGIEDLQYYPRLNDHIDTTEHSKTGHSHTFYIMTLVPMLCIVLLCFALVSFLLIKKGKDKYLYGTGRSFSNPNYYSSNGEPIPNGAPGERKQFIWKRLKYDKSQERVYEETVGTNSPEVASLIPTVLTPCSSNCEVVTPEIERSPSVTPLHKLDTILPVV